MADRDYEAGRRDGRIDALEQQHNELRVYATNQFEKHDQRLRIQERIGYMLMGAVALIEFIPAIDKFLN